jgi:inhibitor of KinA sporulation pathway (predicted exonuclease)
VECFELICSEHSFSGEGFMAKKLDQMIIIDVESTCWDGEPPAGQRSEIIEIGICIIEITNGSILENNSLLIRPVYSNVSDFCTRLTTLSPDQVAMGISFQEACTILKKRYLTKERLWASYGDYDRKQFERQCASQNVTYPFGPSHLNVKTLFAIVNQLPHEVGMLEALEILNLTLKGTHHRGKDDAYNIALIFSNLLIKARGDHL